MNPYAATAAEENRRTIGGKPRPIGCQKQIGRQLSAQGLANLAEIRRPDLLAGFNDELGIEAEPATARLANGAKRRQIDAVLSFVVGGAAAIDTVVGGCCPPRGPIIPPLSPHAIDDLPLAV